MILILSQSNLEITTEEVMDWLKQLGETCLRLNSDDIAGDVKFRIALSEEGTALQIGNKSFSLTKDEVKAVWLRRWPLGYLNPVKTILKSSDVCEANGKEDVHIKTALETSSYLGREARRFSSYICSLLDKAKWLSHPSTSSPNKLDILTEAAKVGISIPNTLITTHKEEIRSFMSDHQYTTVITKPIGECAMYVIHETQYPMYTRMLSLDDISALPESFFPSLFQETLEKEFEIRVFYLDKQCYSMAIFSQADLQTQVDFRQYNFEKPNRNIPYQLPEELQDKIVCLMDRLNLNTGSLDFIKSTDGRLVFLEVNPAGQFGMVSDPCNYYLEKKVAQYLQRMANHEER